MNADRKNLPRRHGGTEESQKRLPELPKLPELKKLKKPKTYTGLANEHLEFLILVSFHLLAEAD